MLVLVIVILIIAIAVAAVAVFLGVFRIEKVAVENKSADIKLPEEAAADDDAEMPLHDLDDGVTLKEKMDINGFLGDGRDQPEDNEDNHEAENPEESSKPDGKSEDNAKADEAFVGYDHLCEVKTGRGYLRDCQKALSEAQESGAVYAAAWMDFDRFRFLNSLRGQAIGDYLICHIGQEFQTLFPEGGIITRISADHFAVVFPVSDIGIFQDINDRLNDSCEKLRHDMALKGTLRLCIGIAITESKLDYEVSVLLHKANIARHCVKSIRGENWKMFESSMISSWLYGESAVEDYNENQYDGDFVIYYSPQMDISLHNMVGCEAIVRWKCEDDVSKGLPQSIDKSKLPTNNRKVIYQACKAMSRWRKSGKQVITVCVSIPATQLYLDDFDAFLVKCLSEFQLEPPMLGIVVDASLARLDVAATARQFKKLRDIGVHTGVDEIDTGYVDIEFLRSMNASFIKLHRSFAHDMHRNNERRETTKRLLESAKSMKLRVIFEGVDVQSQINALRDVGASDIQGHFCGAPQKFEDFMHGLPIYIEKRSTGGGTVILGDSALNKGDYSLF